MWVRPGHTHQDRHTDRQVASSELETERETSPLFPVWLGPSHTHTHTHTHTLSLSHKHSLFSISHTNTQIHSHTFSISYTHSFFLSQTLFFSFTNSLPLFLSLSLPPVDCNDSLYAGDRKLVAEVAKLVHTLLEQVLEHMKGLGTSTEVWNMDL